ncbi:DUF6382 domain-containing protein [Paenibacillus barengoltzii]|uniref:FHA domain-containing protein n=1 Tax=Paenibacillus barengoltzii G22 TaxID=1235795 RepID=R9L9X3_9BACL|nr:DUF6382 domain-containing protein [Paenibacillus barengoltzii]EOS55515.1 hypothetical protein C812_02642 [Paenibacillus barengoltzii G22]
MPELVTDFVRDGGTYMILQTKEGLRPEDLNRVQRSMLAAVTVPNLLRLDIREIDYQISLHYDITGKRMLSQCLRSDKISMPEFYGLLLQVVAVLEDSKRYMLSPSGFLLDETHIFVEEPLSSGAMYFTYVPWKEAPPGLPLSQSLLSLITRMLTCVSRVEGDGIPQLVRLCGDELFSLGELKKMLLHLLSDEPSAKSMSGERVGERKSILNEPLPRMVPRPAVSSSRSAVVKEYVPTDISTTTQSSKLSGATAHDSTDANAIRETWPGLEDEAMAAVVTRIKPTYLVLGLLLVDALGWKFLYLDRPGTLGLALGALLTVLLGVTGVVLWRKFCSSSISQEEEAGDVPEESLGSLGTLRPLGFTNEREFDSSSLGEHAAISERSESAAKVSMEAFVPRSGLPDMRVEPSGSVIPEPESEVRFSPPTVLLSRSALAGQDNPARERIPRYYLERYESAGGTAERIPLTPGSFVIGRSEDIAQYVENTSGVSRAHVEILVTSHGCTLKDLGSTNGTYLNGENVAPYKEYPLQNDDVFVLAETRFKFGVEAA